MREIVYDTETTGRRHQDGHRVLEIGGVELIDGVPTGRTFHKVINPERHIPDDVIKIHGITNEAVANAPTFKQILPEFLEFFRGARVIAHNADFDEQYLNNELKLSGHSESFWAIMGDTVDTIAMSRRLWIGKDDNGVSYKHSLDALLDRLQIDRSSREFHGALLDSQLLAQCYAAMRAQISAQGPTLEEDAARGPIHRLSSAIILPEVEISPEAQAQHAATMAKLRPSAPTSGPKP